MLGLEIILIIVGLVAVVLSYKLSDYSNNSLSVDGKEVIEQKEGVSSYNIDMEEIEKKINQIQDEVTIKVSDELSRISNEKLMGMDEYSRDVLERIEKNHEEVVFLYNMLNEKQTELKQLMKHVDTVKAQLHDDVATEYQKISESLKDMEEKKRELETKVAFDFNEELNFDEERENINEDLNAIYDKEIEAIVKEEEKGQQFFPKKSDDSIRQKKNHNNEIIQLHRRGHSVLEISRMLSLGQGEVKFVIDLYETK